MSSASIHGVLAVHRNCARLINGAPAGYGRDNNAADSSIQTLGPNDVALGIRLVG